MGIITFENLQVLLGAALARSKQRLALALVSVLVAVHEQKGYDEWVKGTFDVRRDLSYS